MLRTFYIIILTISIFVAGAAVNGEAFAKEITITALARQAVADYLSGQKTDYSSLILKDAYQQKVVGVFVTIFTADKESRGCWGELYPPVKMKDAIVMAAIGAVKKDYRYRPFNKNELPRVNFQVSVVTQIKPINSTREINPLVEGLLVRSGSRAGILMPGEAVDAHYQMVQCKLKAGIQPDEPYEMFKLVTRLYKER
jgi:uncharacterized protein (TIGR00296 family)